MSRNSKTCNTGNGLTIIDHRNMNKLQLKGILKNKLDSTAPDSKFTLKSAVSTKEVASSSSTGILKNKYEQNSPTTEPLKSVLKPTTSSNDNEVSIPVKSILKNTHTNARRKIDFSSSSTLKVAFGSTSEIGNGSGKLKSILKKPSFKTKIQAPLKSCLKTQGCTRRSRVHTVRFTLPSDDMTIDENEHNAQSYSGIIEMMADSRIND